MKGTTFTNWTVRPEQIHVTLTHPFYVLRPTPTTPLSPFRLQSKPRTKTEVPEGKPGF
ncbi:hypothetical protein METBIDRAFT_32056 [Metschnikowia bicuspidata var. bicuspidata NRRL YB-4993]|uniref:Uncharacterized protein n=1 Tax=Metschnikowia bicuspidata var. bicuspidata NRRL YB-4993 TaxID=869754 RepID=A0A1A0HBN6_9ASCO|nr:hypothetical protein METBIDRAFT_32056 [Metschnikowia bicuspidata var. bicuspidata NRRL YB-4993]OBA21549.1 hypothetical protein METBIDRAFT_32056 [Metschnikowia bicuspidata var. bicuspidata NRRL YB-4993]